MSKMGMGGVVPSDVTRSAPPAADGAALWLSFWEWYLAPFSCALGGSWAEVGWVGERTLQC